MNSTIKWPSWFALTRHWLSLVGVALVTTAVISWVFVLPLRIRGHVDNPYVGIVIFLILPALFFTGLVLIPIGIYARKRQIRKGLEEPAFDRQAALRRLDRVIPSRKTAMFAMNHWPWTRLHRKFCEPLGWRSGYRNFKRNSERGLR